MILAEGLYERGHLVNFGSGEIALFRNQVAYQQSVYDAYHTVGYGDTLLSIAREYYGYSSLWFMIADANDSIEDIFVLPEGDILLIPNVSLIQSFYGGSQ